MNEDNINKKIKIIILSYPIWDIILTITSMFLNINLPINQVARGAIMLFLFSKISNKRDISKVLILSLILFLGEISYLIIGCNVFKDIGYIIKILFFIVAIYSFENMLKNKVITREDLIKYIVLSSIIITSSIIISPLGLGLKSWSSGLRSGYKGLFMGQNLVNATLLIINPLNMYLILLTKKKIYYVTYLMNIIALCLIGTKSGLVGAILLIVLQTIFILIKTKRTYIKYAMICFSLPIILAIIVITKGYIINFINEQIKMYNEFGYTNIFSFLISNRDLQIVYLDNYIRSTYKYNPLLLFGLGYSNANNIINLNKAAFQAIEMDLYGLLYYSGIGVLILICLIIIRRIYYSIIKLIKHKCNSIDYCIFLSIAAGTVHLIYGGHVIYEALTSLYFAASLAMAKYKSSNIDIINKVI